MVSVNFHIGFDLYAFKDYYKSLSDLHTYYRMLPGSNHSGTLGECEENHIKNDPKHLITMIRNREIIGHAIWHESNIVEHEGEDRMILRSFFQGKGEFAELHELWLRPKYRGHGFGQRFFDFFEKFIKNEGFKAIVYYTSNSAAAAICRKRGYQKKFLAKGNWIVFYLPLYP